MSHIVLIEISFIVQTTNNLDREQTTSKPHNGGLSPGIPFSSPPTSAMLYFPVAEYLS